MRENEREREAPRAPLSRRRHFDNHRRSTSCKTFVTLPPYVLALALPPREPILTRVTAPAWSIPLSSPNAAAKTAKGHHTCILPTRFCLAPGPQGIDTKLWLRNETHAPVSNLAISKTPIGPFQMIVLDERIACARHLGVSMRRPRHELVTSAERFWSQGRVCGGHCFGCVPGYRLKVERPSFAPEIESSHLSPLTPPRHMHERFVLRRADPSTTDGAQSCL